MTDQEKEVILSAETADAEQSSETIDVGITGENSSEALGKTSTDAVNDAGTPPLTKDNTKIDILLKATGNAPIMKKKKWAVSQEQNIGWISDFMKRYLKLDSTERLFLYINQTFAPAPDQTVKNLYDCYGTDGKLVIHYCKSQAWG